MILNKQKKKVISNIMKFGIKKIDYLECLNLITLKTPKSENKKFNLFIAYYIGKIRLIDNL